MCIGNKTHVNDQNRKKLKSIDLSNKVFSSYIRLDVQDKKGVLSSITKVMSKNKISVKRLIQNPYKSKKYSSIVIITHQAKDVMLNKTVGQLSKKKYLVQKPKFIRIESI